MTSHIFQFGFSLKKLTLTIGRYTITFTLTVFLPTPVSPLSNIMVARCTSTVVEERGTVWMCAIP